MCKVKKLTHKGFKILSIYSQLANHLEILVVKNKLKSAICYLQLFAVCSVYFAGNTLYLAFLSPALRICVLDTHILKFTIETVESPLTTRNDGVISSTLVLLTHSLPLFSMND